MQFNFNCEQALGCDQDGVAILEGSFQTAIKPGYLPFVNQILDSMGYNSSKVIFKLTLGSRVKHNNYNSVKILFF